MSSSIILKNNYKIARIIESNFSYDRFIPFDNTAQWISAIHWMGIVLNWPFCQGFVPSDVNIP